MPANDRQVGGNHYRSKYQHWDFAIYHNLWYMEGQITKYITRHRIKNGKADLEKALHFVDKLIEAAGTQKTLPPAMVDWPSAQELSEYVSINNLTVPEWKVLRVFTSWESEDDLKKGRYELRDIMEAYP